MLSPLLPSLLPITAITIAITTNHPVFFPPHLSGTYFPEPRLLMILDRIHSFWSQNRTEIINQSEKVVRVRNLLFLVLLLVVVVLVDFYYYNSYPMSFHIAAAAAATVSFADYPWGSLD